MFLVGPCRTGLGHEHNVSAELPATVSNNFGRGTKAVVKVSLRYAGSSASRRDEGAVAGQLMRVL